MGCPRTDASQASVSSASLTASRPRPQTQPSLKRRRGKRFISLQISQSQPGEGPSLASPGGTEETGPAAEERSVRREVAPPPASASTSTPTPAPRGAARSHLPGTAHAAGGGGREVRRVFSRPHPTWPRRPRLLTPPGPSAHVPRAAPGRPRHRPDWQRAPANRGGERLLPANGSGGPRRTAGRRSAPPVRTLSARRPMAAPEERRGSARPPRPEEGGGAVAVTTAGPPVAAGPGARGPSPTPGSGAVPRAERQSSASCLLPPLSAGRLPVLAGLPPPPARASPPPRLPLPPALPGSGLHGAGAPSPPGWGLPRPRGTCGGGSAARPPPSRGARQLRPQVGRGGCSGSGGLGPRLRPRPRSASSRLPAPLGRLAGSPSGDALGEAESSVVECFSIPTPLRTRRSVFTALLPTCIRIVAPDA